MNIGSLIPIVVPVAQMPVAAAPGKMPSFEQLMPAAKLTNSIVGALPEQMPSFGQPMPEAVVTNGLVAAPAAVPQAISDFAEEAAPATMTERILKPAPDAKLQSNTPRSLPRVIALPFRTVTEAKTLKASIAEPIKTPDGEGDERPVFPEALSFISQMAEASVAILPVPSGPFVELKPAPTVTQREPETADVIDLLSKSISTEKPATSIIPFQAASEAAQPAAITQSTAPSEPVATGHLDLARDTLWLDQLTREIVAAASSDGRLKFRLSPETLGNLDVAISTQADGVNIQLQPSTETAARILAAEQPKLAEELRQSGIRLINSDLLGGQQMGNARDQSQAQHSDRWLPSRQSPQPTFLTPLNPAPTQPQRGRFA
jgi:flagellar hook-length control protein FliK